jgi:hypothetical protein
MTDMNHATRVTEQLANDAAPTPRAKSPSPNPPGDAAIRYVSFLRRLPDGSVKHAPVEFPIEEMRTWEQVVALWGGGEYQAIAKDSNHRVIRHYPGGTQWMSFAGEPKPLVRPKPPRRAPAPTQDPRASILTVAVSAPEQQQQRQAPHAPTCDPVLVDRLKESDRWIASLEARVAELEVELETWSTWRRGARDAEELVFAEND